MNNIYPLWWSDIITVYNKYEDQLTHMVSWYRTIIDGAFWKYVGDSVKVGETVLDTNSIICRIRKDDRFLEPYVWQALAAEEKANHFTLQGGDIIIHGGVSDEVDEYTSGHRSTDLVQKYKDLLGCMEIERVAINVGIGRGQEHYLAKGI
jgi:hypothetical protein